MPDLDFEARAARPNPARPADVSVADSVRYLRLLVDALDPVRRHLANFELDRIERTAA